MKNTLFVLIGVIFLFGCGEAKKNIQKEFMQSARGEIGEIILVMDSAQYEGALGQKMKSVFRKPMQGLPQDEPLFSLSKAGPRRLNSVLKSAANMIFVMTLDSKSRESDLLRGYFTSQSLNAIQRDTTEFYSIQRDQFAKGQLVLFLFAKTEEQLIEKLDTHQDQLRELFESTARNRIQSRIYKQRETNLEKVIKEDHPFEIKVPYGWEQAKNLKTFYWMRFLESDKEQDVFVYYEPYTSQEVFNDIGALRDRITQSYLRDPEKTDLYITRQERPDIKAIFTEPVNFDGRYAVKTRGLWKYSDISGGGPYISYTLVDEKTNRLYYIEGFVYAPSTKKKNYIRELDAILSTFALPKK
jgi:nitrate reductase NapAB chaperone NapD